MEEGYIKRTSQKHMAHSVFKQSMTFCSILVKAYLLQVLFMYTISQVNGDCRFPRYLETPDDMWTANYKDHSSFQGTFKGTFLRYSKCNSRDEKRCVQYVRKCLSKITDEKYEVQQTQTDGQGPPQYLCVQFLKRSNAIIQVKESVALAYRSPNACMDDNLTLDNWPLVNGNSFYDQKVQCPFSGGYNVRISTSSNDPLCPSDLIPPRLESECEQGDGITINFRNKECMDEDLEMELEQSLFCAASWTHGKYTFIILRPQEETVQVWCLRITGTGKLDRIYEGHLFMDFVCDGSDDIRETTKYLYLEIEQRVINSICADLSTLCDEKRMCNHPVGLYCPKSCGSCNGDPNLCSFPAQYLGHWAETQNDHKMFFNISYYDLNLSDAGRFLCYENDGHNFENGTMLLQTFDNGCFPRFVCMEIRKPSSSTLEYRLGNRVVWPVENWENLRPSVCHENMFKPNTRDKLRLGKQITEKPSKILVDIEDIYPVHCQINDWAGFRLSQLYIKELDMCDSCLSFNPDKHSSRFVKVPLNCSAHHHSYSQKDYKCIGVFPQDELTHAVVTRTLHERHEFLCWVFVKEPEEAEEYATIYVLEETNCNKVAIDSLKTGNLSPKHKYTIPKNTPRRCPYIDPEIPPTTTPLAYVPNDKPPTAPPYRHESTAIAGANSAAKLLGSIFVVFVVVTFIKVIPKSQ